MVGHCIGRSSADLLASVESVGKMMTIKEKAVELRGKNPDAKNSSGNCWEGGNVMTVGAWFVVALLPRPIISGRFSPIGRKVLMVMTGTAAVRVGTNLRVYTGGLVWGTKTWFRKRVYIILKYLNIIYYVYYNNTSHIILHRYK